MKNFKRVHNAIKPRHKPTISSTNRPHLNPPLPVERFLVLDIYGTSKEEGYRSTSVTFCCKNRACDEEPCRRMRLISSNLSPFPFLPWVFRHLLSDNEIVWILPASPWHFSSIPKILDNLQAEKTPLLLFTVLKDLHSLACWQIELGYLKPKTRYSRPSIIGKLW